MATRTCTFCDLHKTCKSVKMPHVGAAKGPVDILFVGSSPNEVEDVEDRAWCGEAGVLLRLALKEYDLERYRWAATNAVKCKPPTVNEETRKPSVKEIRACAAHLEAEIAALKPRIIVPMGNIALQAVAGLTGITKYIGREIPHESGAVVFPMFHPAAILEDESKKGQFEAGFQILRRLVAGKPSGVKHLVASRGTSDDCVKALDALIERAQTTKGEVLVAIDIETAAKPEHANFEPAVFNPRFAYIKTCAIAYRENGKPKTLWFEWPTDPGALSRLRTAMSRAFICPNLVFIAHNAPFEVRWFLHNVVVPKFGEAEARKLRLNFRCTMLLHHLIDENSPHGLEVVAAQYTDMGGYDNEVALLVAGGMAYADIPLDVLGSYNAGDSLATLLAYEALWPKVCKDKGLRRVWDTVLRDAVVTVAWFELNGRRVDFREMEALCDKLRGQIDLHSATINDSEAVAKYVAKREAAGKPLDNGFNPNSSQQVGAVLFNIIKIPSLGKTETGAPSVKSEYITPFKDRDPFISAYLAYKGATKLLEKLTEVRYYTGPDGMLYGSYLLHGTVTGRLSSASPNLQNFAETCRSVVSTRAPDTVLLEADYSQLELRLVAEAAGCEPLLRAFRGGLDPHKMTASLMFGVPIDSVDKDQRYLGKVANFLLTYGGGPRRLMIQAGLSEAEAHFVSKAFHRAYPEIREWMATIHLDARANAEVRSRTGRLRRLPDARSAYPKLRMAAEREAGNFPIQNLGSDLNTWSGSKVRMIVAERGMRTMGLGLTHDSGLYEVPRLEVPALVGILHRTMIHDAPIAVVGGLSVPLDIEVKVGPTWGTLTPYDGKVVPFQPRGR